MKRKKKHGCIGLVLAIAFAVLLLYFAAGDGKIEIMKFLHPIKYQDSVEKWAEEYSLDKYLVYSVIKVESRFNSAAESHVGAKGLMQLMDKTASECNTKEGFGYSIPDDLFDSDANIRMGCSYLRQLIDTYGDIELAVTAYNAGTGNVKKWLDDTALADGDGGLREIPYEETRKYVRKVMKAYENYTKLYKENSL